MINPKPKPAKKVKTKKTKRKNTKRLLEVRADKLVKEIILLRDGSCVCPSPENGHSKVLQPGHLISRGKKSVRWDLRNVHCQCSSCNLRHVYNPHIYTNWYLEMFGFGSYTVLVQDSQNIIKPDEKYLETLCRGLESTLVGAKLLNEKGAIHNHSSEFYLRQDDLIRIGEIGA